MVPNPHELKYYSAKISVLFEKNGKKRGKKNNGKDFLTDRKRKKVKVSVRTVTFSLKTKN